MWSNIERSRKLKIYFAGTIINIILSIIMGIVGVVFFIFSIVNSYCRDHAIVLIMLAVILFIISMVMLNKYNKCVDDLTMIRNKNSLENVVESKADSICIDEIKMDSREVFVKETIANQDKMIDNEGESEKERSTVNKADLFLEKFENLKVYDMDADLDELFLKKFKRTRAVDYEKFMKPSGTTERPSSFVVFDLETTGLSPNKSEIIEIGAIRFKFNEPVEIFHTYIKPKRKISEKITSINGITNDMVENAPSIEDVLPKFIDFIQDDVLIAHNSDFDMKFILQQLYDKGYKKIKNKVIDTLKLSRQKVREIDYETYRNKKLSSYKLENLKYEFGIINVGSHNALDDCKVCAYVYIKIKGEYGGICYTGWDFE